MLSKNKYGSKQNETFIIDTAVSAEVHKQNLSFTVYQKLCLSQEKNYCILKKRTNASLIMLFYSFFNGRPWKPERPKDERCNTALKVHRCCPATELIASGPNASCQLARLQGLLKDKPLKLSLKMQVTSATQKSQTPHPGECQEVILKTISCALHICCTDVESSYYGSHSKVSHSGVIQ